MGSGSSKGSRKNTCSPGQVFKVPAFTEANGKGDQNREDLKNKSGMHNQTKEKPSIFLSEDIWQRVAMHMTTKEWVQVSGTCKTMSKVQFPCISLRSSSAAAVAWASKHSRTSESLSVIHKWDQQKSNAVSAALQKDGWDLRKLEMLRVCLEPKQGRGGLKSWTGQVRANRDADMWAVDMLSNASNVKRVYLMGVNLAGPAFTRWGFPALTQLVCLCVTTPLSLKVCSSIGQLSALQFLRISKGPGLPDMQVLPTLNLSCNTALHDLVLEYVWLSTLFYRPGINVHFSLQDSQEVSEDVINRGTKLDLSIAVILPGPLNKLGHLPAVLLLKRPERDC